MTVKIGYLTGEIPVVLPAVKRKRAAQEGVIRIELFKSSCSVRDPFDWRIDESYTFVADAGDPVYAGRKHIIEYPRFDEVFRYLTSEYAANRNNPIGEILRDAVAGMEAALAVRDGSNVYFAGAANRIKIGWSKKVGTRIAQLQTGNPDPIKLLGTMPGGRAKELEIQRQFAHARVSGEWFEATPDLLAFIGASS